MSRRALATADQTRTALLDTAERLFREVGYGKTTVSDIAAAMGMSSANVYRFFASKSAINNAICDRLCSNLHAAMARAAMGPGAPAARLEAAILAYYEGVSLLQNDERRVFDMVEAAITENWTAIEAHIAACNAIIAGIIADGVAVGAFAAGDPAALAETVLTACKTLFHPMLVAGCADDPRQPLMARRLIWLAIAALTNPNRSPMP